MTDDTATMTASDGKSTSALCVDPWPKNLPYWNYCKRKYTSKCLKYFNKKCFRCGFSTHESKDCPNYTRFERMMCETCRRGFHRICRYSEIIELSKNDRTETEDKEERQYVGPTIVMTKEKWFKSVENISPQKESPSNSPIEDSESLNAFDVMQNKVRRLYEVNARPSQTGPVEARTGPDNKQDRSFKLLLCFLFATIAWYIGIMYDWRDD